MPLKIITADERLRAAPKINIALFGPSGVGKTTQARTLDPATTLFIDLEAGTLAIQEWTGDVVDVRQEAARIGVHPWELARALVCWLSGPDPAASVSSPYGQAAYDGYCQALGDPAAYADKRTLFWDSITVAARMCLDWSRRQPEAFSEKTGKPDNRGAYGLHGQEMVRWLTQIQHMPGRSTIVVGILERIESDDGLKRVSWEPQIDGSKAGRELPGIFDEVITLSNFTTDKGEQYRAFVTHQVNPFGFPAKDRSGRLDLLEPPDLGALMKKIHGGKRVDGSLVTALPPPAAPEPVGMPASTEPAPAPVEPQPSPFGAPAAAA